MSVYRSTVCLLGSLQTHSWYSLSRLADYLGDDRKQDKHTRYGLRISGVAHCLPSWARMYLYKYPPTAWIDAFGCCFWVNSVREHHLKWTRGNTFEPDSFVLVLQVASEWTSTFLFASGLSLDDESSLLRSFPFPDKLQ